MRISPAPWTLPPGGTNQPDALGAAEDPFSEIPPVQLDPCPGAWEDLPLVTPRFVRSGGAVESSGHKRLRSVGNVPEALLAREESGGLVHVRAASSSSSCGQASHSETLP